MGDNCLEVFVAPTDITTNNNSSTDADITIIANMTGERQSFREKERVKAGE